MTNLDPPSYELLSLSVPLTDAHIHAYATLRLSALQTNPECFSSTYERESAFTKAQWKERLNGMTGRATIIASTLSQEDSGFEWVGTVTIIGHDILQTIPAQLPDIVSHMREPTYAMVGMWVHPEHRRRGLGRKLVEGSFAWVRGNVAFNTNGNQRKILLLETYRSNENANALYESMGFQQVPGPLAGPEVPVRDTVWMVAYVEPQEP